MRALAAFALLAVAQDDPATITDSERARAEKLLGRLAEIMRTGEHDAVEPLLSPNLPPEERDDMRRLLRRELSRFEYKSYDFAIRGLDSKVNKGEGEGSLSVMVTASYEYATRGVGPGASADRGEFSWRFTFDIVGGKWYLGPSDFFLTLSEHGPASIFSTMFFLGTLGLVFVVFWLWTTADCFFRTRSATRALLVLLTPPVGSLVYAVTAWLRKKEAEEE